MSSKHGDDVNRAIQGLEADRKTLVEMALEMCQAHGGDVYPLDLYANGAINRSLALSAGFQSLIEQRNILCAGAILRLQIDTAIRFYASFIVDDPHSFATDVLKGVAVRKLKDRCDQFMTDAYLVKCLKPEYGWIDRVYETTSGYIHMSDVHIASTFDGVNADNRSVGIRIGWEDTKQPASLYLEAIAAFRAATAVFARYLHGWIYTKANPGIVAEARRKQLAGVAAKAEPVYGLPCQEAWRKRRDA
jgi:hypothetical protein